MDTTAVGIVVGIIVVLLLIAVVTTVLRRNNTGKLDEAAELRHDARERETQPDCQNVVSREPDHRASAAEQETPASAAGARGRRPRRWPGRAPSRRGPVRSRPG